MKHLPFALPRGLSLAALSGFLAVLLLTAGGCRGSATDGGGLVTPVTVRVPDLQPEPEFTAGLENQVAWNATDAPDYQVEKASDQEFSADVSNSDWIPSTSYVFTGLEDGRTYFYRVRARDADGNPSAWSAPVASTQDAAPPVTGLASTFNDQTSLRFKLVLEGTDQGSGTREIDLWFAVDNGEPRFYGTYAPGEMTFLADGQGRYHFFTEGVDAVGNRSVLPAEPQVSTQVPEPIIITDNTGEDFDITNAVLKHRLGVPYWDFGLGRNAIPPVIDPRMLEPGDPGYPDDQNTAAVIGVRREGDIRAYRIGDIPNREVVDDVVGGEALAVTY